MNQIIQSYLDAHIKEYEIESYDQSTAFEHFINKCIINRLSTERFDPIDVMTDDGEIGLDGVAILLNGQLVTDLASIMPSILPINLAKPVQVLMEAKLALF